LPKELRGTAFRVAQLDRQSIADASGRYHFRVGPGRYTVRSRNAGGTEPLTVEVKNEAEIVSDLALKGPARESFLSGVVVEKTPTGDRPIPRAIVHGMRTGRAGGRVTIADDQGRFQLVRVPGGYNLYAADREHSLAARMPVSETTENITLVVSKGSTITGQVIDSAGTPQAKRMVGVTLEIGPDVGGAGRLTLRCQTDERGRFNVQAIPVGAQGEVVVSYRTSPNPTTPRTVARFEVVDTDPVVIPDLIVPAEKPTK
jgi:hypothetical protein